MYKARIIERGAVKHRSAESREGLVKALDAYVYWAWNPGRPVGMPDTPEERVATYFERPEVFCEVTAPDMGDARELAKLCSGTWRVEKTVANEAAAEEGPEEPSWQAEVRLPNPTRPPARFSANTEGNLLHQLDDFVGNRWGKELGNKGPLTRPNIHHWFRAHRNDYTLYVRGPNANKTANLAVSLYGNPFSEREEEERVEENMPEDEIVDLTPFEVRLIIDSTYIAEQMGLNDLAKKHSAKTRDAVCHALYGIRKKMRQ